MLKGFMCSVLILTIQLVSELKIIRDCTISHYCWPEETQKLTCNPNIMGKATNCSHCNSVESKKSRSEWVRLYENRSSSIFNIKNLKTCK